MKPIAIVDYGMANLRSVQKAFEKVGAVAEIVSDPNRVAEADRVVLPGVGAFRDAIARLRDAGLAAPIRDHIARGKPFFGICLGLQLLFERSHEDGDHEGLGILAGDVVRFADAPGLKVPHMGWNALRIVRRSSILGDCPPSGSVYFVHSYYVRPTDPSLVAAEADYPSPFAAAVWRDNLFATQYHPEKSQKVGLAMLARFAQA